MIVNGWLRLFPRKYNRAWTMNRLGTEQAQSVPGRFDGVLSVGVDDEPAMHMNEAMRSQQAKVSKKLK